MKPSELKASKKKIVEDDSDKKKYPCSSRANPPITAAEIAANPVSHACPRHSGLIKTFAGKDGQVFFCGTGKEYWRYSKPDYRKRAKLKYPPRGIV